MNNECKRVARKALTLLLAKASREMRPPSGQLEYLAIEALGRRGGGGEG
jgi:hypothetical protein